jgi:hypothetical protein
MQEHTEGKPAWWVWTSKDAPRTNQTISLLAVGETVLSATIVWGIAWYFDSYGWLLYSLIISPLLLLRSPESMDAGVRWMNKRWVHNDEYKQWHKRKKITFVLIVTLLSTLIMLWPSFLLAELMLADQLGWRLALLFVGYGTIIGFLALVVIVAVGGAVGGSGVMAEIVGGAVAGAGTLAWTLAWTLAGAGTLAGVLQVLVLVLATATATAVAGGVAVGSFIRALVMRTVATVTHWVIGFKQLPYNWRENCFVVDFREPPTLMPIDEGSTDIKSMNTWNDLREIDNKYLYLPFIIGCIWFIPAYIYRFNIKSTFWFYWPLVFFLKPISSIQKSTPKTQILYSISNIGIILFNVVPILWLIYFVGTQVGLINTWEAVPVYAQYLLVLNWGQLEYWDLAHISVAGFTFAMVVLSCGIQPYYKDGYSYHASNTWVLPLTIGLYRARGMSVIVGLVLAFGSVFINLANEAAMIVWLPEFLELRIQDTFTALRSFYNIQPLTVTPQ